MLGVVADVVEAMAMLHEAGIAHGEGCCGHLGAVMNHEQSGDTNKRHISFIGSSSEILITFVCLLILCTDLSTSSFDSSQSSHPVIVSLCLAFDR
jgi:hypothetical protein